MMCLQHAILTDKINLDYKTVCRVLIPGENGSTFLIQEFVDLFKNWLHGHSTAE
jgi:hypothetical protein